MQGNDIYLVTVSCVSNDSQLYVSMLVFSFEEKH